MNEKEKIKLLDKLYKKYGDRKSIFRLEEDDKHNGDSYLETIEFEEWKNFVIWGRELDLFLYATSFGETYNQVILKDRIGCFLENKKEEMENERMRIENERLRLLMEQDDRINKEMSFISGVPCGLSHPNSHTIYEGDVTVNNTRIQGNKNEVNNGGDATVNDTIIQGDKNKVKNGSDLMAKCDGPTHYLEKENEWYFGDFWNKHWKWIIGISVTILIGVLGLII